MGTKRRKYTREFKLEALRTTRQPGMTSTDVARELDIAPESLYRWKREFKDDPAQAFPGEGALKARDREVEQLRRQVARLQSENAFLKKVSAYFAKDKK